jgi:heterotetrameric sarcosine oxidase gamma subunit
MVRASVADPAPALQARDHLTVLALRVRREAHALAEGALNTKLPVPGRTSATGELTVLPSGPTEFLVVSALARPHDLIARMESAMSAADAATVDVSSNFAVLRLSGPHATYWLSRGCSIELEPPAFTAGACATTKVGRVTTLIHRVTDQPCFDCYVLRSLSASLRVWLEPLAAW